MASPSSHDQATSPPKPTSKSPFTTTLISPATLHAALSAQQQSPQTTITTTTPTPRIIPLSAAWFLPNDPHHRTGHTSYLTAHIPGSVFFDLDAISDRTSPYPHMLPTASAFSAAMSRLGLKRADTLIVYDSPELGLFSAPRVAWTLRVFGHKKVFVLDNFKAWVESGEFPVESGEGEVRVRGNYHITAQGVKEGRISGSNVADLSDVADVVVGHGNPSTDTLLIDARPRARWEGSAPEPRAGIESGHMPNSISIPFTEVLDPVTKTMLPREELRELFKERFGEREVRGVVSSCGTGVTAAVVDLALEVAGLPERGEEAEGKRRVYDGSWTEWATKMKGRKGMIVKSDGVS